MKTFLTISVLILLIIVLFSGILIESKQREGREIVRCESLSETIQLETRYVSSSCGCQVNTNEFGWLCLQMYNTLLKNKEADTLK